MNKTLSYLKAARLPFLTATAVPVLLGSVLAWYQNLKFNWCFFWLTFLGVAAFHTGTNLINDYFDHKSGNDEANLTPTPFSGGSRVIQEGRICARNIFYFSIFCFIFGSIIGLYLNFKLGTNVVLILGIIGAFLGFFYTATPLKIGYRGMGELAVGFGFGPLVVLGAYYVQARELSISALVASVPIAILVLLILYINEFPDYEADKKTGKNTIVVLLGKRRAVYVYQFLLVFTYLSIFTAVYYGIFPAYSMLAFLTLPLAFKAAKNININFNNLVPLLFSNAATIKLHLFIGLLLSAGFILDRMVLK